MSIHTVAPSRLNHCFEHNHMTFAEFGLYKYVQGVRGERVFYFNGRSVADEFVPVRGGTGKDAAYLLAESLCKKGWFKRIKKGGRTKTGIFEATQYITIEHDEWALTHPNKCRRSASRLEPTSLLEQTGKPVGSTRTTSRLEQNDLSAQADVDLILSIHANDPQKFNDSASASDATSASPAIDISLPHDSCAPVARNTAPASSSSRRASISNPSRPTPEGGMENSFAKKDEVDVDVDVDDQAERDFEQRRQARLAPRHKKDYAISKSREWRALPREVQDRVKAVVKSYEREWEHWATRDDDGTELEDRRSDDSFPVPSAAYKLQLARKLFQFPDVYLHPDKPAVRYTDAQAIQTWSKFPRRPQGFDGLDSDNPWTLFLGNSDEFEVRVGGEDDSSRAIDRQQSLRLPPIAAFVAAFAAERVSDGWLARRPLHADSNPSLLISQNQDGKILVRCRGGCNQADVWRAAVDKARTVPADELPILNSSRIKTPKEFTATQADVDAMHALLRKVPEVQKWLNDWGITAEVADKLQVGAQLNIEFERRDHTHFKSPALAVPHYDLSGKLVALKSRSVCEKGSTQKPGGSIDGLFAAHLLDSNANEVLIFEGEKDVAIAMSHGFNATGVLSAQSKTLDADIARLGQYSRVYVIGDQDETGIRAMDRLVERLLEGGVAGVVRVYLPDVKDAGELFAKHPRDFKNRLTDLLSGVAAAV